MNYSLDHYNTFKITIANIKYLRTNLMKDVKYFYTYKKHPTVCKTLLKKKKDAGSLVYI